MERVELMPGALTLSPVLSEAECEAEIAWAEAQGFEAAPVSTTRGAVMLPEVRNNARVMVDDPAKAACLWARINAHIKDVGSWGPVGLNERFRYYRYHPGQRFAPHQDGSFRRDETERSFLTFLIYLNGGCEGGETRLPGASVSPQAGLGLLFRHELLHEGAALQAGVKYVLRSDVMFRRR
jgi:prolyl 4-hydroxylase